MSQVLHPYFRIFGEFDPDEVTRLLELEPSLVQRIGDPGPPDAVGPRQGAEWVWQPQNDHSDDVGDQLAYLAGSLSQKRDAVTELSKKFCGTFHVYHEVNEFDRDWYLSASTLRLIANLHVAIECDNVRFENREEVSSDAN